MLTFLSIGEASTSFVSRITFSRIEGYCSESTPARENGNDRLSYPGINTSDESNTEPLIDVFSGIDDSISTQP